ncbi:MAG TPA: hypothetical protein DCM04_07785 [Saprospirales bacterium]|jgi:hypothetical protein|nr:hypothetical protein [Saprospirales bacterium]|tara:strand:- start:112 stop:366 length:255 start_codon:yes stop_codon:yes gene_type:complete
MSDVRKEIDQVISELSSQGYDLNDHIKHEHDEEKIVGLGDAVEAALTKFGITQERFKYWFNLKECNCTKRKKWLNSLFSWKKRQ